MEVILTSAKIGSFLSKASLWLPREYPFSAWYRNAPFAFWLVDSLRPRTIVELGTHHGFSYLCFCQAVDQLGLDTRCYAIDTWQGDEHAGFYGEEVLQELRLRHDGLYSEFSSLIQSTFDDALSSFDSGSVDLLHIDGRHYYDDVAHDFESWLPKMSENGVVLFHDIEVRERGFGVRQLWSELSNEYPSFAILDEHGLGVLVVGSEVPEAIAALTSGAIGDETTTLVRALYQRLGDGVATVARSKGLELNLVESQHAKALLGEREAEVRDLLIRLGQLNAAVATLTGSAEQASSEVEELRTELNHQVRERRRLRADLKEARATLLSRNEQLADAQAYIRDADGRLNEIYTSSAWRGVSRLRSQAKRHPRALGTPIRIAKVLRRRSSTMGDGAESLSTGDMVDWRFVEEQAGRTVDRDRYLNQRPSSTFAPLRIVTDEALRESSRPTMRAFIDDMILNPGSANPLLEHDWWGSASDRDTANLRTLSARLPEAQARLSGVSRTGPLPAVDVLIPVFNAPIHVDRCIRSLYANSDASLIGTVFVLDDASDNPTRALLDDLKEEFGFTLARRTENLGFTENVNRGLVDSTADLILLLNSDCYVGPGTVSKLALRFRDNDALGLASPMATSAPPVSLPLLPGFSYNDMERQLDTVASNATYSACTVVGNCLMIRRSCFETIGGFGDEWGVGYGEETDYQFRAREAGFQSAIAADAFVFHEGGASFGSDDGMAMHRTRAYDQFMAKWGPEYRDELSHYMDPALDLTVAMLHAAETTRASLDVLILLPALSQVIGGTMVAMDLASDLIARGRRVSIAVPRGALIRVMESVPFDVLEYTDVVDDLVSRVSSSCVVATAWTTVDDAIRFAETTGATPIKLVQGYEPTFASGESYGDVIDALALIEHRVTVSTWLGAMLDSVGLESTSIVFGPDLRLFSPRQADPAHPDVTIGMMLRGTIEKGDPVLLDIVHRLRLQLREGVRFTILDPAHCFTLATSAKDHIIRNPLSRDDLAVVLRDVDIWVDASLFEGYGRLPVEAMASGATVVMGDTGGGREYSSAGVHVVESTTNSELYIEQIKKLVGNRTAMRSAQTAALEVARQRSWMQGVTDFDQYLANQIGI